MLLCASFDACDHYQSYNTRLLHEKRVILFRELVLMMTLRYLNTLNQRQSKPGLPFQVPDFPPVNISAVVNDHGL